MKQTLINLIKKYGIIKGEFTLASGFKTDHIYDMKKMMGIPSFSLSLMQEYHRIIDKDIKGIASPANASNIAWAIQLFEIVKYQRAFFTMFVRDKPKEHGIKRTIEGHEASPVLLVDDVMTSGETIRKAYREVEEFDMEIRQIIPIILRDEYDDESGDLGSLIIPILTEDDFR